MIYILKNVNCMHIYICIKNDDDDEKGQKLFKSRTRDEFRVQGVKRCKGKKFKDPQKSGSLKSCSILQMLQNVIKKYVK